MEPAWPRRGRTVAATALVAIGVIVALRAHDGPPDSYETRSGPATRLDGSPAPGTTLSVAEAIRIRPQRDVDIAGYLYAPFDDTHRLCTTLNETAGTCGAPSVALDTSRVDLFVAQALERGCCSIGHWSPRPVVLRVNLTRSRATVLR